jgi:gamma-glutamylcyclotransferase (GGCT)/AIG2-like uncharacterized protein YtfP
MLTKEEMHRLDAFEGVDPSHPESPHGVYRREHIQVVDAEGELLDCIAYVKNQLEWIAPPSEEYLHACKRNIEQFWSERGGVAITVRKGDGTIVTEWSESQNPQQPWPDTDQKDQQDDQKVRAIFAYGTLMADCSENGDMWGVCAIGGGCTWSRGQVRGFSLYQEAYVTYPFATEAPEDKRGTEVVHGTVISWPSDEPAWQGALKQCDGIEGYEPGGTGLYNRSVVRVALKDEKGRRKFGRSTVLAYMYHQDPSDKDMAACRYFPEGDWLEGRKALA